MLEYLAKRIATLIPTLIFVVQLSVTETARARSERDARLIAIGVYRKRHVIAGKKRRMRSGHAPHNCAGLFKKP